MLQLSHLLCPSPSVMLPSAHGVHDVAPAALNELAAHGWQLANLARSAALLPLFRSGL